MIQTQNAHYHGLHLKDLFKLNLSYYGIKGRYTKSLTGHEFYDGKAFSCPEGKIYNSDKKKCIDMENKEQYNEYKKKYKKNIDKGGEVQLLDKINYYSLLMKYSYLAIDHIIKKFQIN